MTGYDFKIDMTEFFRNEKAGGLQNREMDNIEFARRMVNK
jgi:hypothetical protein